jgi:hypothetical protein
MAVYACAGGLGLLVQAHNPYYVHITSKFLCTLELLAWINNLMMEIGSQLIVDEVLQNDLPRDACSVLFNTIGSKKKPIFPLENMNTYLQHEHFSSIISIS